ncbi:MAG: hypothetical protein WDN08_21020 [Rhizomicrobium sp.]
MDEAKSCGDCTVCCTALAIDTPELRKVPGVACRHCTAQGCGIYETRFPICRSYFCGWFGLPELGDAWRPDRSGILIAPRRDGIPPGYALREGVEFLVLGGEAAIRRPAFVALLGKLLAGRTPCFIGVPGPAGHYPARVFLNDRLGQAAPGVLADAFAAILKAVKAHRFEPMPAAGVAR